MSQKTGEVELGVPPTAEPVVVVVVDTTAMYQDRTLSGSLWTQLLSLSSRRLIRVAVPRVVLLEAARQQIDDIRTKRHELQTKLDDMRAIARRLNRLGVQGFAEKVEVPEFKPPSRDSYVETLTSRLTAARAGVIPVPNISHDQVIARDLDRRLPFQETGKGYRDTLVWESLLEHSRILEGGAHLYFVTSNRKDYYPEGGFASTLHKELHGSAPQAVFTHCEKLTDLLGLPLFAQLLEKLEETQVSNQLEPPDDVERHSEWLTERIAAAAEALTGDSVVLDDYEWASGLDFIECGFPPELTEASVETVDPLTETVEWNVYDTYEGDVQMMQASLVADVSVEGFIDKGNFHVLDDVTVSIIDARWNSHTVHASASRTLKLFFNAQVNAGSRVVHDIEFDRAEADR